MPWSAIERSQDGYRVIGAGTTRAGRLDLAVDAVIAATGFATPLRDLPALGVRTFAQGRIPALTPYWESEAGSGIYFAGSTTQGAAGLKKHGVGSASAAVHGFRYNARAMAVHLAETHLGLKVPRPRVERSDVVPYLLREATRAPNSGLRSHTSPAPSQGKVRCSSFHSWTGSTILATARWRSRSR
jgi:hypothetical protein